MTNPFLARAKNRGVGDHGRKAEKPLSKKLRGRLTPASGASSSKGDIRTEDFMIESKSTVNESLTVQREWLTKLRRESLQAGTLPALALNFVQPDGKPKHAGEWVAIPLSVFLELTNK